MAWLGPILGGLALVVALAGFMTAQRTQGRIDALEERVTEVAKATEARSRFAKALEARTARASDRSARTPRRTPPARRRGGNAARKGDDRPTPGERKQRVRKEMTQTVEDFGTERGLDDAMVGEVLGELEARGDAVRAVLQDLAAGAVSADQAREEVQWVRDESAQSLRDLLGEDLYVELDRHLAENAPRRRRAALASGPSRE